MGADCRVPLARSRSHAGVRLGWSCVEGCYEMVLSGGESRAVLGGDAGRLDGDGCVSAEQHGLR